MPPLEGDDHPAVLGAVLLAETVEVDGEIGVVAGEGSHVLSPGSTTAFPVSSATVSLALECKVKPFYVSTRCSTGRLRSATFGRSGCHDLDLAPGCRVYRCGVKIAELADAGRSADVDGPLLRARRPARLAGPDRLGLPRLRRRRGGAAAVHHTGAQDGPQLRPGLRAAADLGRHELRGRARAGEPAHRREEGRHRRADRRARELRRRSSTSCAPRSTRRRRPRPAAPTCRAASPKPTPARYRCRLFPRRREARADRRRARVTTGRSSRSTSRAGARTRAASRASVSPS